MRTRAATGTSPPVICAAAARTGSTTAPGYRVCAAGRSSGRRSRDRPERRGSRTGARDVRTGRGRPADWLVGRSVDRLVGCTVVGYTVVGRSGLTDRQKAELVRDLGDAEDVV